MNMTAKNRHIAALMLMFAMVHATNTLYVTFVPLYLDELAFTAAQRGVLMSIGPFVSMLTMTMWGSIADRSRNKVRVMFALAFGLMGVSCLFLASGNEAASAILPRVIRPYYVTIFATAAMLLYSCFQNPMLPMIDTITMEYLHENESKVPYGVIRMAGTISFVIFSLVVGRLISASAAGTKAMFYVMLGVMAVLAIDLIFVPPVRGKQTKKSKSSMLSLVHDRWYCTLAIAGFLTSVAYGFNASYYPTYFTGVLGASKTILGINSALGSTLEIFLFLLLHKILKKTGLVNLIMICLAGCIIRWSAPVWTTSVPVLIGVQFFTQPLNWSILVFCMATYIQKAVPDHLHARAQTLINMIMASIARIVGSLGGGWLLQRWGVGSEPRVYLILAVGSCIAFAFTAISFWKLGWRPGRHVEFTVSDGEEA